MRILENHVAIVTGAGSGIGRATAVALARSGAHVVAVGRTLAKLEATMAAMAEASGGVPAMILALDVRSDADMAQMASCALDRFGRIDSLVASAGSGGSLAVARRLPFAIVQLPASEWDEVIDTNLKGVFFSNRAVLPAMMKQRGGNIINVSSARGATMGLPYAAAYSASKHGVMGLTAALAEEVRSFGIRVQTVLPDVTETPMLHVTGQIAPQGLLTPETVAGCIIKLITLPPDTTLTNPVIAPFAAAA